METVEHLSWAEALDMLRSTREELLEALESVPEEPIEVWAETHAFGEMLMGLPPHDMHHADQVRRWRDKQGL